MPSATFFKRTFLYSLFLRYLQPTIHRRRASRAFHRRDDPKWAENTLYQCFIRPGDLVFDVGANMGMRTKLFLQLGARVVAIEPQKACAAFLSSVLPPARATVVNKALGSQDGQAELHVSTAHTLSSLSPEWIEAIRRADDLRLTSGGQGKRWRLLRSIRSSERTGCPPSSKSTLKDLRRKCFPA